MPEAWKLRLLGVLLLGWAPALWDLANVFRQAPGFAEGIAKQHFDLGVDAAKVISCPAGEGIVHRWV